MKLKSLVILAVVTVLFTAFILVLDSASVFVQTGSWRDASVIIKALPFVVMTSALSSFFMCLPLFEQSQRY